MTNHSKPIKDTVNGVLLLNKSYGISSNLALQKIKKLFNAKKAGHTGTLDPLATGLLPICFGEATKYAQYMLAADKSYLACMKLGEATTTGDIEGDIVQQNNKHISLTNFQQACLTLIGSITQTPPMYSAIKHQGKPLYEYARAGVDIEREKRTITIHAISIIDFNYPHVTIEVTCSKGTYIRTLCEDIAQLMGTYAHLTSLSRIQTGPFQLSDCYCFDELEAISATERINKLLPVDTLIQHFNNVQLKTDDIMRIKNGRLVHFSADYAIITTLAIYDDIGNFIGLGEFLPEQKQLKALRLISN